HGLAHPSWTQAVRPRRVGRQISLLSKKRLMHIQAAGGRLPATHKSEAPMSNVNWIEDLKYSVENFSESGNLLEVLARLHDLDAARVPSGCCGNQGTLGAGKRLRSETGALDGDQVRSSASRGDHAHGFEPRVRVCRRGMEHCANIGWSGAVGIG